MNRREYLTVLLGATSGVAGCATLDGQFFSSETATGTPDADDARPVPMSELTRGAGEDDIPAIIDPAFGENWSDERIRPPPGRLTARDPGLSLQPDDQVISVKRKGEARAYPLRLLNWHEVVNETFHEPLLVTYCPLCGSGVTAVRTVDGEETTFGVSGYLWKSNLVMYDDATDSLWSQLEARAIRGPQTGETLSLVPSRITTWESFQEESPGGKVLLPPPKSETVGRSTAGNYKVDPYSAYAESRQIGVGENDFQDDRLHPKTTVIGLTHDGTAKAYPLPAVSDRGVVNDDVSGLPVVVATTPDNSLVAYERTVDGTVLSFSPADGNQRHMTAGGSRWEIGTGIAVDSPHEGTRLVQANDRTPLFWFAWLDFNPDSELYGG